MYKFLQFPILFVLIGSPFKGGLTNPIDESGIGLKDENLGLYNSSDKVISLYSDDFKSDVLNQKTATLLEFYNSFCGHCRRFAPKYKQLAEDIYSWRKLVKVSAIDCANDKNNDICREYEILSYPTIRYFSKHFISGTEKNNFGLTIATQDLDVIKETIVTQIMNDTRTDDDYWPNFSDLNDTNSNVISNLPSKVQYVLIIYEPENSTLVSKLILEFSSNEVIQIRRTTSPDVAAKFNIESPTTISIIDNNSNTQQIHSINNTVDSFKNAVISFLEENNILSKSSTSPFPISSNSNYDPSTNLNRAEIIENVKKDGLHVVHQADLEHALRFTLFNEIPRYSDISGERLLALQRYINILDRYSPLGKDGQDFIKNLRDYVINHNQNIEGAKLQEKLKDLEKSYSKPLFSQQWIGCTGSKNELRGFTCGLWKLFHYITITAAEQDKSTDPLEVLQAIHGYVKYFFGCTDCSNHFQDMATRRRIWNTTSKDEAILWLWASHNEVNSRLAGDETEDPFFPKVQFPTKNTCSECYREPYTSPALDEINWDKQEILQFLKRAYNSQNISRDAIDEIRPEKMTGNVFSDMDMRMIILLYGFCVIMMAFAVKLFMCRGYRKKPYPHSFLGKV